MGQEKSNDTHTRSSGIKLSRNAMMKERMYARTLPALKHANERKIKEGMKDENDQKEYTEAKQEDKKKLHAMMDQS